MPSTANKYLLDSSAPYPLILLLREDFLEYSKYFIILIILDLTVYEIGNTVWKEYRKGRIRDLGVAARLFQEIINNLAIQGITHSLEEILNISVREGLTFHDAFPRFNYF